MKNIIKLITAIFITLLLVSCKKGENGNIFFVSVIENNIQNGYYNNGNTVYIDVDMDGTDDILFDKQQIANTYYDDDLNYYVTDYINSIEIESLNNVEFSSTDDCMNLLYSENEISADLNYQETVVTLANDYNIPCNRTIDGRYFIGFRIQKDSKWHYGWMQLDYDLDNNNRLNFSGWAYHKKSGKSIYANQQQ